MFPIKIFMLAGFMAVVLSSCGGSSPGSSSTTVFQRGKYDYPTDITVSSSGKLYVANNIQSNITVYDSNLNYIKTIKTACAPRHIAINEAETVMYVGHDEATECVQSPLYTMADSGGRITIVELDTNTVVRELQLDDQGMTNFRKLYWDETAKILYASSLSGNILLFDTENRIYKSEFTTADDISKAVDFAVVSDTGDVETMVIPQSGNSKFALYNVSDPDNVAALEVSPWSAQSYYYITNKGEGDDEKAPTAACVYPSYIAVTSNDEALITCHGNEDYENIPYVVIILDVSDFTATSPTVLGSIQVGKEPSNIYLSDDESFILVVNSGDGTLYYIPWSTYTSSTGYIYGLSHQVGSTPSDLAVIGDYAYVTDQLSSTIYKIAYKNSATAIESVLFDTDLLAKNYSTE